MSWGGEERGAMMERVKFERRNKGKLGEGKLGERLVMTWTIVDCYRAVLCPVLRIEQYVGKLDGGV